MQTLHCLLEGRLPLAKSVRCPITLQLSQCCCVYSPLSTLTHYLLPESPRGRPVRQNSQGSSPFRLQSGTYQASSHLPTPRTLVPAAPVFLPLSSQPWQHVILSTTCPLSSSTSLLQTTAPSSHLSPVTSDHSPPVYLQYLWNLGCKHLTLRATSDHSTF